MYSTKQQVAADTIRQYQDAFIVGALNPYEFAGKIISAIRFEDMPKSQSDVEGTEIADEADIPQTESEAYRFAN